MRRLLTPSTLVPCAIIAAVVTMVVWANLREGRRDERRPSPVVAARSAVAGAQSRDALEARVAELQAKIDKRPDDLTSVVLLAATLIRQSRVTGSAGPVMRAQALVGAARREAPEHYDLLHIQGQLWLSQHKFTEAATVAEQCKALRPNDASVYGMLGDAHLELGDYDQAFKAFDEMMRLRPSAAAYARVSYARELQGDYEGALKSMKLAADASGGDDLEGMAWTHAQVGELLLRMDRPGDAMKAFAQATQVFPGHPFAVAGYARALDRVGKSADALALLERLVVEWPTPEVHAQLGDLFTRLERPADAARQYALAEAAWRSDAPEPKNLARFLADRGVKIDEAVAIAEQARAVRNDIYTDDALAWAYFKAGRVDDARRLIAEARRTGSKDRDILRHAAAIDASVGARATGTRSSESRNSQRGASN